MSLRISAGLQDSGKGRLISNYHNCRISDYYHFGEISITEFSVPFLPYLGIGYSVPILR